MPSSTYIELATFTATGTETSVTFSNIPNTYRDLVIHGNVLGNQVNGVMFLYLNGDTANRSGVRFYGLGSGSGASDSPTDGLSSATIGTTWGTLTVNIMDYSATDKHKMIFVRSDAANQIIIGGVNRWASNNAVNTIQIGSNRTYQSGMTLSLYGIAG